MDLFDDKTIIVTFENPVQINTINLEKYNF